MQQTSLTQDLLDWLEMIDADKEPSIRTTGMAGTDSGSSLFLMSAMTFLNRSFSSSGISCSPLCSRAGVSRSSCFCHSSLAFCLYFFDILSQYSGQIFGGRLVSWILVSLPDSHLYPFFGLGCRSWNTVFPTLGWEWRHWQSIDNQYLMIPCWLYPIDRELQEGPERSCLRVLQS